MYRNVTLRLTDGERVVYSRKKPRMAPGEMESVTLKGETLRGCKGLYASLEVE